MENMIPIKNKNPTAVKTPFHQTSNKNNDANAQIDRVVPEITSIINIAVLPKQRPSLLPQDFRYLIIYSFAEYF